MKKLFLYITLFLAVLGIMDATYLTYKHYSNTVPPCSIGPFADCGKVLKSDYATLGSVPLALLGLAYYSSLSSLILIRIVTQKDLTLQDKIWNILERYVKKHWYSLENVLFSIQFLMTSTGFLFSLYFVYLQINVIQAICLYCMISALLSTLLFVTTAVEGARVRNHR